MNNYLIYWFIPKERKLTLKQNIFIIKTFLNLLYSYKNEFKEFDFKKIKLNEIFQEILKKRFLFQLYLKKKKNRSSRINIIYKVNKTKKLTLLKRNDKLILLRQLSKKPIINNFNKIKWSKTLLTKINVNLTNQIKLLNTKNTMLVSKYLYLLSSNFIRNAQNGTWYKINLQMEEEKFNTLKLNIKYNFFLHQYKMIILKK